MNKANEVLYVGLNAHKDSIAVAYAPHSPGSDVVTLGNIGTRHCDIDKMLKQLQGAAGCYKWCTRLDPVGSGWRPAG
jgi:hypothetical protein